MNRNFDHGPGRARARALVASSAAAAALALGAAPAQAQDLVHRFINPSFGGNPFYSEHLLATANIHRPDEPDDDAETPTDEDLIAQQIRARLLSQLSGDIIDRIQNAAVGDTGNFELGNQQISFTRTATETRITFTNTATGEVNTIVIPATADPSGAVPTGRTLAAAGSLSGVGINGAAPAGSSAEQSIGGSAAAPVAPVTIASGRPAASGPSILRSAENTLLAGGPGSGVLPPF